MPVATALGATKTGVPVQTALAAALAQRDRLQASLAQLGLAAPLVLRDRLATTTAEVTRLTTLAQRQTGTRAEPTGPTWALRRRPQETWDGLDAAGRRAALAPLLAGVVVRGKAVVAVSVRGVAGSTHTAPLEPVAAAS